jgi:C-terminal processing protease CtpA/Prc
MKLNIKYILLIIITIPNLVFTQTKKTYNVNEKFNKENLLEDVNFLQQVIATYHPKAYAFSPKNKVDSVFESYKKSLPDSLTERAFRNQLYAITEVIKCGHAGISSSKARQKYFKKKPIRLIPLDLYCVDSQIIVLRNLSKDSAISKGAKILKIDGVEASTIITTIFKGHTSDGYNLTNRWYAFERGVQFEYVRFFPEKDTFELTYLDNSGKVLSQKMPAISSDSLPLPTMKQKQNFIYSNKQNHFYLAKEDSTVAVLDLLSERMFGYKKFYKKSFRYLAQHKIEKLIIDLRGNGGGFMLNPGELLSYFIPVSDYVEVTRDKSIVLPKAIFKGKKWIWFTEHFFHWLPSVDKVKNKHNIFWLSIKFSPKRKLHYKGKIVVLTDGGTFSAASFIAAYIKKHQRATIIGTETGGGEAGCAAFLMPQIELPNTKLQYRLPLYQIKHNTQPMLFGRGVFPDIEVKYSIEDVLKSKDKEMKLAIEQLNKQE